VIPLPIVQDHQLRIQGSATYLPIDFEDSISMLAAGAVDLDEIVTAQLPLADAGAAFDLASGGHHVKVLLAGSPL
jgi:threonine dehydrogenase-like Zn-dependent dehydrogenase